MGNNGKTVGAILIVVGVLIFLGGTVLSVATSLSAADGSVGGAVLGAILALFISLPVVGGGMFMVAKGRAEAAQQVDQARLRKILDMVKTRGQVDLSALVIEFKSTTDQIHDDVYKLVGMGLFTGYVNWEKGVLYSQEASKLKESNTCPNCNGQLALGGKGVITCPYCGTEIFL
jgi:hypothetical protein